jgi:hypothetical protein
LEAIGRPARSVCFVELKYAGSGPDEQEALIQYFHDRYGMKIMHADPAELTLRNDEVYYQDDVVDLAYRDYSVSDLIGLARTGVDVEPMRALFRQNRIGPEELLGDFDRSPVHAPVLQPGRTANLPPAYLVDPSSLRPAHAASGRPHGQSA